MKKIFSFFIVIFILLSCDFQVKYNDVDKDGDTVAYESVKFRTVEGAKIDDPTSGISMQISPWSAVNPVASFNLPITLSLNNSVLFTITLSKTVVEVIEDDSCPIHGRKHWKKHDNHPCKGHCVKCRPNAVYDEKTGKTVIITTLTKTIQYQTTMGEVRVDLGKNEKGESVIVIIK